MDKQQREAIRARELATTGRDQTEPPARTSRELLALIAALDEAESERDESNRLLKIALENLEAMIGVFKQRTARIAELRAKLEAR